MEKLINYLQYSFIQNAILVGVIISIIASLFGVLAVNRRYSLIEDSLSSVAFAASTIASVLSIATELYISLPITVIFSVGLFKFVSKTKIQTDAAMGLLSVSAVSLGYLLLNIYPPSSNLAADVCTTLFGTVSILTLTTAEVIISILVSILSILIFVINYNKFYLVATDERYASTIGISPEKYNTILAIFIGIIIVLSINLVGSLLTTALIIFPPVIASRLVTSFKHITIGSVIISGTLSLLGIIASILLGTPVGATIVTTYIIGFFISQIASFFLKRALL